MKRRGTNVDHVLVGPAGVFVIDSKNLDGRVHCDGDTLSLRRPGAHDEGRPTYKTTDPARGVRGQSAEVSELVRKRLGASAWVSGVVVTWAGFEQGVSRGHRMDYVRGGELVTWLRSRDVRLNAEMVDDITLALGTRSSDPGIGRGRSLVLVTDRIPTTTDRPVERQPGHRGEGGRSSACEQDHHIGTRQWDLSQSNVRLHELAGTRPCWAIVFAADECVRVGISRPPAAAFAACDDMVMP